MICLFPKRLTGFFVIFSKLGSSNNWLTLFLQSFVKLVQFGPISSFLRVHEKSHMQQKFLIM